MYRSLPTRPKNGCYCCCGPVANVMDIDLALHELGMLSTVTDSRHQYLQEMKERNRTLSEGSLIASAAGSSHSAVASSGFQLLQIDTNYVQGVSAVSPGPPTPEAVLDMGGVGSVPRFDFGTSYRNQEKSFEAEARRDRMTRIRNARLRRFNKPYVIPGRLYHSFHEFDLQTEPMADRQKSKSNSSSPTKSSGNVILTRSRSLDNLSLAKAKVTEFFDFQETVATKQAVEDVSREMGNLQVTE